MRIEGISLEAVKFPYEYGNRNYMMTVSNDGTGRNDEGYPVPSERIFYGGPVSIKASLDRELAYSSNSLDERISLRGALHRSLSEL